MQTAQLLPLADDDGIHFAYIDSGAPPGDTYTTLICVHGYTYHAQNFSRLLPLAQKYNVRVIALNRRDYIGSTPFSQTELESIFGTDRNTHVEFLRARGLEIARFLVWVISEKMIPRASADGLTGGLALMGWSLGNLTAMAFLRHLGTFPSDIINTLEPYLKTFFIYEAGYEGLGYPDPEGMYHPLKDASIPQCIHDAVFGTWVSSYYSHPIYASLSSDRSRPDQTQKEKNIFALQVRAPEKGLARRVCTTDTFTPSELAACVDLVPVIRSEQAFARLRLETLYDQTRESLLLEHAETAALLPQIKVRIVYGYATVWSILWGIWELERDCKTWESEGRQIRPLKFCPVEDSNHFLHWDEPEMFLKVVAEGIKS
ncbi:hypothetical protein M0805_008158 [Coniferiporia weirii]|nr:hypothetical protein M0805_008158 [Coniferiporia weirii]